MNKIIFIIFCCMLVSCKQPVQQSIPDDILLAAYANQTHLTDPGEYKYLYDGLPKSYDSLCALIKCQLIHPLEALQMGYSMEQVIEEGAIASTEQILQALLEKDSTGLSFDRAPDDRLLIACHHHAMLLASILRSRDIPVRMRFGFARYFEKEAGVRFGHVICEVWDDQEQRWVLVDPDREYVDFSPDRFDYAHQAWLNLNKQKIDPQVYVSSIGDGWKGTVNLIALDAAHVLLEERMHWDYPEIALQEIGSRDDLEKDEWAALDEVAQLLNDPDKNFSQLDSLYSYYLPLHSSGMTYEDYGRMMEERE